MTGFLLDTNAVSLLAPVNALKAVAFIRWLREQEAQERVYLSAITIHEMEKGVRLLEGKGASAKAAVLSGFVERFVAAYVDRILVLDLEAARESGRLEARSLSAGHDPGIADCMIAGIACSNGLTVVTRNVKHFRSFGIMVLSPDDLSA